jgi:hypothetical protein
VLTPFQEQKIEGKEDELVLSGLHPSPLAGG